MSWTYVMDLCHGPMSWTYVMDQCHEPMPSPLTRLVLFKGVVKYIDLCHQPPFLSGGALLYDSAANLQQAEKEAKVAVRAATKAAKEKVTPSKSKVTPSKSKQTPSKGDAGGGGESGMPEEKPDAEVKGGGKKRKADMVAVR
eukprot:17830-Prorocentrum_minimum.AAC.2